MEICGIGLELLECGSVVPFIRFECIENNLKLFPALVLKMAEKGYQLPDCTHFNQLGPILKHPPFIKTSPL